MVGCFGLTEPDAGSDPGGMKTRAKRSKDGFVLNGSKMWITNSPIADIAVVWAKLEEEGIHGFVVERHEVVMIKEDFAGDDAARRLDEPHDGKAGDGFAAARFADQRQRRAFRDGEADIVNRSDDAGARVEIGAEIFDFEDVVLQCQRLSFPFF